MTRKIGRLLGMAGVAATLALVGCKSDPDPVEPPDDPPPWSRRRRRRPWRSRLSAWMPRAILWI